MTAMPALTIDDILAALTPPARAERFSDALKTLARYEADPQILKSELADLRQRLNRGFEDAWTTFIRKPFLHDGRFQSLSEAERKLDVALGLYPECHTAVGYRKRVLVAKAEGVYRDTMIDVLNVIVPIAERAVALKDKVGKRAPQPTKTSLARDARDEKAMHCQCCGRAILAETGVIAHHGYRRPAGMGFQTRSCYGARELPFEVSRDALGRYIAALHAHVVSQQAYLAKVREEAIPLTWTYTDRTRCAQAWDRGQEKSVSVTRQTLAAAIETARAEGHFFRSHIVEPTFDGLKDRTERATLADIGATKQEIDVQQARYDGWTQTHKRAGDHWVAIAA